MRQNRYIIYMMQLPSKYKSLLPNYLLEYVNKYFKTNKKIYLHWVGGELTSNSPSYNAVIGFKDDRAYITKNFPYSESPNIATYARNSNSIAISCSGMLRATTEKFHSKDTIMPEQIEKMIELVGELCWKNKIHPGNVITHGEAAENLDIPAGVTPPHLPYGYNHGCERWDWWCLIDPITLHIYPISSKEKHIVRFESYFRYKVWRYILEKMELEGIYEN
jgi:hypothetical protein